MYLERKRRMMVVDMRSGFTYDVWHDSQMPQVSAVDVLKKVMEAVGAAVCTCMPGGGLPDAMKEGKGEGLVEDDERVAGLPEGVEEGNVPGG